MLNHVRIMREKTTISMCNDKNPTHFIVIVIFKIIKAANLAKVADKSWTFRNSAFAIAVSRETLLSVIIINPYFTVGDNII
jgi:hypothetical protein